MDLNEKKCAYLGSWYLQCMNEYERGLLFYFCYF